MLVNSITLNILSLVHASYTYQQRYEYVNVYHKGTCFNFNVILSEKCRCHEHKYEVEAHFYQWFNSKTINRKIAVIINKYIYEWNVIAYNIIFIAILKYLNGLNACFKYKQIVQYYAQINCNYWMKKLFGNAIFIDEMQFSYN